MATAEEMVQISKYKDTFFLLNIKKIITTRHKYITALPYVSYN